MRRAFVIAIGSLVLVACQSGGAADGGTSGSATAGASGTAGASATGGSSTGAASSTATGGTTSGTTGGTTGGTFCMLSLVAPPLRVQSDGGESVIFTASLVTNGTAIVELRTNCAAGTQVQFDSTPSGGQAQSQDAGADDAGDVSFDLTGLMNGSMGTFTADIDGGAALPEVSYEVNLVTVTPPPGNLLVVATQDNLVLDDAGTNSLAVDGGTIIANEAQCAATCVDFTVSGLEFLGTDDGGLATLILDFGGGPVDAGQIVIASGQPSVTFSAVSMPANSYPQDGTVTLTLTDSSGPLPPWTWDVVTDVLEPTAPVPTPTMLDMRAASVNLSWTVQPQGADSPVTGYTLAVLLAPVNSPPPALPTEPLADFGWKSAPVTQNGQPGDSLNQPVAVPALNLYSFELRAVDSVGNQSALVVPPSISDVTGADPNAWQTLTITENDGNEANSDFGYVMRTGDFNGDGHQDLVITAPYQFALNPTPGIVYIMNGTDAGNLAKVTFAGLASITLGGTDYDYFGQDAHVADYNGDGVDDLAVGAPYFNTGQGRIDIFFGHKLSGLSNKSDVTIYGDPTQTGYFGYSVSSADVNGDGIPDLLVGAPGMGSGSGSVYVFFSAKNWPVSSTNPSAGPTAPAPTSIISGNAGDGLGAQPGIVPIGDINGDDAGDFAIGAPGGGETDANVYDAGSGTEYGISGASVLANNSISVSTGALFKLVGRDGGSCGWGYNSPTPDVAGEPLWECFGVGAIGDVSRSACNDAGNCSFTGGALPDLIVSSAWYSRVSLYEMTPTGPLNGGVPPAFTDSPAASIAVGWTMVASDLNGDGHPDLLVGPNDTSTGVYLYLNTGTGLTAPSSGEISNPDLPDAGSYFGYAVTAGDYTGSGKQDFAISDDYPLPYVNVYY